MLHITDHILPGSGRQHWPGSHSWAGASNRPKTTGTNQTTSMRAARTRSYTMRPVPACMGAYMYACMVVSACQCNEGVDGLPVR